MADDLKGVVVWNNLLIDGRDYCGLWHTAVGRLLKGTVVGVLKDQRPLLASYEIHCDENWLTHRVQVDRTLGNNAKTLSLSVGGVACGAVRVRSVPEDRGIVAFVAPPWRSPRSLT